jgi:hypothetical protein
MTISPITNILLKCMILTFLTISISIWVSFSFISDLHIVARTDISILRKQPAVICPVASLCALMQPISIPQCFDRRSWLNPSCNTSLIESKLLDHAMQLRSMTLESAPIVVLFEGRIAPWDMRTIELLLLNAIDHLPPTWNIHIFIRSKVIEHLNQLPWFHTYTRFCNKIIIHEIVDSFQLNKHVYNRLLSDQIFWKNLAPASHVQIIEIDSGFCPSSTHSLEEYTQYDYCGAQWVFSCRRNNTRDDTRCVGNSGFSLWNRNMMVFLSQKYATEIPDNDGPELLIDQFWGDRMRDGWPNINICPPHAADLYSVESIPVALGIVPIGYHKPFMRDWTEQQIKRFENICYTRNEINTHVMRSTK